MQTSRVVQGIGRLALSVALAAGLVAAEADPRPLEEDEVARAEEALRQLTAAEQPVEIPEHIGVLLAVIRRQLDDCQAYLQVEMGSRAGLAFLAAQRSLEALDDALDEQMPAAVLEQVAVQRRRLDAVARRLLQDQELVPLDPDHIEQPLRRRADETEGVVPGHDQAEVAPEAADAATIVSEDPDAVSDQDAAEDVVTEDAADATTEDTAVDPAQVPPSSTVDDQEP